MWTRLGLGLLLLLWAVDSHAATRTTLQSAAAAVGNGTVMSVDDKGAAGITVTGTFVGTIAFEGSADGGTTWSAKSCNRLATPGGSTTTTSTGQFLCDVAGLSHFRAPVSAFTSGTITVVGTASNATTSGGFLFDSAGNLVVSSGTCGGGESFCEGDDPDSYTRVRVHTTPSARITSDTQIKASAGWVSHMTCAGTDATATAGTIILYNSLTETGTILQQWDVLAVAYTNPIVFPIMAPAATGIYLGFTTTADVACTVFFQ